jgi:hypothetical protein
MTDGTLNLLSLAEHRQELEEGRLLIVEWLALDRLTH